MTLSNFKQCTIEKKIGATSIQREIAFLPEEFAHVGKKIKVSKDGGFQDGWVVVGVGGEQVEQKEVLERAKDFKIQRKASDRIRKGKK